MHDLALAGKQAKLDSQQETLAQQRESLSDRRQILDIKRQELAAEVQPASAPDSSPPDKPEPSPAEETVEGAALEHEAVRQREKAAQLLGELRDRDVHFWIEGETLRYSGPEEALTPPLLTRLEAHQHELLALLEASGESRPPSP